jgi:hypothetical protein
MIASNASDVRAAPVLHLPALRGGSRPPFLLCAPAAVADLAEILIVTDRVPRRRKGRFKLQNGRCVDKIRI